MHPNLDQHNTFNRSLISCILFLTHGIDSAIQSKVFHHSVFFKLMAICPPYWHKWGGEMEEGEGRKCRNLRILLKLRSRFDLYSDPAIGQSWPFHRCLIPKATWSGETAERLASRWEGMEFESKSEWEKKWNVGCGPSESKSLKFIALLKIVSCF